MHPPYSRARDFVSLSTSWNLNVLHRQTTLSWLEEFNMPDRAPGKPKLAFCSRDSPRQTNLGLAECHAVGMIPLHET
jgi:hypothetical protein